MNFLPKMTVAESVQGALHANLIEIETLGLRAGCGSGNGLGIWASGWGCGLRILTSGVT